MSVPVHIHNISKSYEKVEALKDINLEIKAGELFGFIGPDGAGKTSLFRILTGLILPRSGTASVGGLDVVNDFKKIRQITGYMPGRFSLYHDLTVAENLDFYASIFKTSLKENYDLIKDIYIQIEPFRKRKAGDLSGGMKQKLALSCALIHRPELLILDEPTTGVDAVSRKEFWELLNKMQQSGITILVSTPYMDEAALCNRVALMQNGKLLATDTPKNITKRYQGQIFALHTNKMHSLVIDLENTAAAAQVYRFGDSVHITSTSGNDESFRQIITASLEEKGHSAIQMIAQQAVIEDCFLALMDKNQTL
ncbi:MAG: ABC transporter ATP-binding protein [Bacteroidales bacterium]|nr:ABC transporter ATP-binding protein [Bacteroidales bacterium]